MNGGADCFVGGGEVEVDGDFSGEEDGDVCDHATFTWREDDADSLFLGGVFDFFGECDGGSEDFLEGEFGVVGAVVEGVLFGVFSESF